MRTIYTTLILSLGLSPQAAFAAAPIKCPAEIQQSLVVIKAISPGWTPHVARPIYLHGAGAAAGPPDSDGQLRPDDSSYAKGKTSWRVTYNLEGNFPRGKWLECSYGSLNQIVLSRRLADETSACTVSYRKGDKEGQNIVDVACR